MLYGAIKDEEGNIDFLLKKIVSLYFYFVLCFTYLFL